MNQFFPPSGSFKMNWISQPYSFTEQAVSFCEMRAGCLTRGAGGPGGGGSRGMLPQEHYGLCWQLWSERGIPELTAELPTASARLPDSACLPASLLSVSLHSHNTKLCLSSTNPTALKASVSALREKTLFMQRKPPLHTGMLTALIPRHADTKLRSFPSGTDSHNIFCLLKIVVSDASSPKKHLKKFNQMLWRRRKKHFPLNIFKGKKRASVYFRRVFDLLNECQRG